MELSIDKTEREMTKAEQAMTEIEADEVLEDRREYDVDMLARMYGLTEAEAAELFELIQARFR